MNQACDELDLLLKALQTAGRNLTSQTLVNALNGLKDVPMGIHANVTFAPGKFGGADQQRTIQYHATDCKCWKVVTDFSPLFVP